MKKTTKSKQKSSDFGSNCKIFFLNWMCYCGVPQGSWSSGAPMFMFSSIAWTPSQTTSPMMGHGLRSCWGEAVATWESLVMVHQGTGEWWRTPAHKGEWGHEETKLQLSWGTVEGDMNRNISVFWHLFFWLKIVFCQKQTLFTKTFI